MAEAADDPQFLELVLVFQQSAWIALGKIQNPANGKTEVSLPEASHAIDMLAMLDRKTRGKLTVAEGKILSNALTQLRLNYVEVAGEKASAEAASRAAKAEPSGDEPGAPGKPDPPGSGE